MSFKEFLTQLNGNHQMQFSPVEEDDDELSQAINADPVVHDNQWDLQDGNQPGELSTFWDEALHELGPMEPDDPETALYNR